MFDDVIQKKLGDYAEKPTKPDAPDHVTYSDGFDPDSSQLADENDHMIPNGTVGFKNPINDQYTHAVLNLSQGELMWKAKVVSRPKYGKGESKGSYEPNTFLNNLTYDVEFPDIKIKKRSANVVAETCILKQIMIVMS